MIYGALALLKRQNIKSKMKTEKFKISNDSFDMRLLK